MKKIVLFTSFTLVFVFIVTLTATDHSTKKASPNPQRINDNLETQLADFTNLSEADNRLPVAAPETEGPAAEPVVAAHGTDPAEGEVSEFGAAEPPATASDTDSDVVNSKLDTNPAPPITEQSVIVNVNQRQVTIGAVIRPHVTFQSGSATETSYTLSSSNEDVLQETENGWTAVGGGTAELIAVASNGATGRIVVTVVVPVKSLELNTSKAALTRGDRITLYPIIYPADATNKDVLYTTSDPLVATVSQDGMVHAAGVGTATIKCTAADDSEISAACSVTVILPIAAPVTVPAAAPVIAPEATPTKIPVKRISINTDKTSYRVGEQCRFTVKIHPENATDRTFTLEIRGAKATLLDKNTFFCDASGKITLTATVADGVTGSKTIDIFDATPHAVINAATNTITNTVTDTNTDTNTNTNTGTDNLAYANEVFRLVNIERQNAGLNSLTQTPELTRAAEARANDLTVLYSHSRPDGRDCWTAYNENNVVFSKAAENIASGHKTPEAVMVDWMNSPEHRANILNAEFEHIGVGVATNNEGRHFWAQNFSD